MKNVLRVSVVLMLVMGMALLSSLGCSKKSTKSADPPEWTILVYSDGNNNLDYSQGGNSYCIQDIQDMEKIGSTSEVNIVAMVSSLRTGGIAKYYHIEYFPDDLGDNISSTMLSNKGTKDMSDPQTLREFLNYGFANYPAKKYMLLVDDHGGGWRGICEDEQNGSGNLMSMVDFTTAVQQSLTTAGVQKFDIITFHACLMSMVEVAYQLRNCANYMAASEFSMPMESVLGTEIWLEALKATPTMSGSDLANSISPAVYQSGVDKQKIVHMATTDLSKMQRLAAKIDDFGTQIHTSAGEYWMQVFDAWGNTNTTEYDDPANVDLREFALKIKQEPDLQNINLIRYACDSLIAALNDAIVITNTNAPGISRGGMTIYLPYLTAMYDQTNYGRLAFAQLGWANFVEDFIATIEGLLATVVVVNGTVSWPGHTLTSFTYAYADTIDSDIMNYRIHQAQVDPATGQYSLIFQLNNSHIFYFEAVDDVNNNQQIDAGDGWSGYDLNQNGVWDTDDYINIQPGQTYNGINFTLHSLAVAADQRHMIHKY
jgi:hypothetical protein